MLTTYLKNYLMGSISSFSRGKDSGGTKGGHWTERSERSGWSDSGTPDSASLHCKLGTRNAMHFSLFLRSKKPPKEYVESRHANA